MELGGREAASKYAVCPLPVVLVLMLEIGREDAREMFKGRTGGGAVRKPSSVPEPLFHAVGGWETGGGVGEVGDIGDVGEIACASVSASKREEESWRECPRERLGDWV